MPNGREDIFSDRSIDVRAKRGLMKFLKFVIDFENQSEVWEPHGETSLPDFLVSQFQLPTSMQTVILALTLSLDLPSNTSVRYALPRIARHLTSIGVFGPGFGAVVPKWGGGAEMAQVACRAGAVGGAVYVLGTGVSDVALATSRVQLKLTNGEDIRAGYYIHARDGQNGSEHDAESTSPNSLSRTINIISSDLSELFKTTVEGAPTAAVSVVAFPTNSLVVDGESSPYPVYIMAHSSDTGECPQGQCKPYSLHIVLIHAFYDDPTYEYLSTLSDTP
jgi:RAB protein geranylgeranyltransferase component A